MKVFLPENSQEFNELFTYGDVPYYRRVHSIRLKYFLPWTPAPKFSKDNNSIKTLFNLSRFSAWAASIALLSLIILGITNAWA